MGDTHGVQTENFNLIEEFRLYAPCDFSFM